ncbi:hypothetical protein ACWGS9_30670 [Bradyrhizobium sp. Arg314]
MDDKIAALLVALKQRRQLAEEERRRHPMTTPQQEAAKAVVSRLIQMRQLWIDAAENYFEPKRFLLSLQQCITVGRSVTFVLQAQKGVIKDFDAWYAPHVLKMAGDPIMIWARDARNSIEKRGDLNTLSQVRAEIVASYLDGPATDWMPEALFASPREIFKAVPKKFRIPHIVENGTLVIERRWVDEELPEIEVLEAMAHVYGQLADLVEDLLRHLGIEVPSDISDRPDVMGALAMDRALYLSMRDGSQTGLRYFQREAKIDGKALKKRYGKGAVNWKIFEKATTFREMAEAYFRQARILMAVDGYHRAFAFLLRGNSVVRIIAADHPDRASRYLLMRDLARLAHIDGADGVMFINEAWTALENEVPETGFAVDAKNRGEVLALLACNAKCETYNFQARIIRKKKNPTKVKRLEATVVGKDVVAWMLYPFQRQWGCVDEKKMMQGEERLIAAGVKLPTVAADKGAADT